MNCLSFPVTTDRSLSVTSDDDDDDVVVVVVSRKEKTTRRRFAWKEARSRASWPLFYLSSYILSQGPENDDYDDDDNILWHHRARSIPTIWQREWENSSSAANNSWWYLIASYWICCWLPERIGHCEEDDDCISWRRPHWTSLSSYHIEFHPPDWLATSLAAC